MAENNCNGLCHPIYPEGDGHIRERKNQDEKILGSKDQFCAAFYHVPEWDHSKWPRIAFRQHFCLDEDKCVIGKKAKELIEQFGQNADNIAKEAHQFANELAKEAKGFVEKAKQFVTDGNKIAEEANEFYDDAHTFQETVKKILKRNSNFEKQKSIRNSEKFAELVKKFAENAKVAARSWYIPPDAMTAVVKFEKVDGSILYEARYTNCTTENKLAEDFFEEDIKKGLFKEMIEWDPNGTVTLYLTLLQEEEDISEEEEEGVEESQRSSCAILKQIVTETLRKNGRQIKLLVKPTNVDLLRQEDGTLNKNAAREIKDLMSIQDVYVNEMTHKDWDYLFAMTTYIPPRQALDSDEQDILRKIHRINLF